LHALSLADAAAAYQTIMGCTRRAWFGRMQASKRGLDGARPRRRGESKMLPRRGKWREGGPTATGPEARAGRMFIKVHFINSTSFARV
jgi:hypothetical protein